MGKRAIAVGLLLLVACDGGGTEDDGGVDSGRDEDGGDPPVESCEGQSDGTACDEGSDTICIGEECVASRCGDGFVDEARGEQCEEENDIAFDGCEPDTCLFTCADDATCADTDVCNGQEQCVAHRCELGAPAADGTPCDDVPDGVCHPLPEPACIAAECGNGLRDADEACDDGRNGDATDGCADDCELACTGLEGGCTFSFIPESHDFGMLAEGQVSTVQPLTIQNVSLETTTDNVTVVIAGEDASNFTIADVMCVGRLGSLVTCSVTVRFDPVGAGTRRAMIVVRGGAGEEGAAEVRGFAIGDDGRACTATAECQSGNCVDGFCCNESESSCSGCRSCGVSGSEGTCSSVPSGEDPHGECAGLACSSGVCNGAGACAADRAGTECQFDGCSGAALVRHHCNDTQTDCPTATSSEACAGQLVCAADGTSCRTSCTEDAHCVAGTWCDGSACRPLLPAASSCTRNRQCGTAGGCYQGLCRNCVLNTHDCWSWSSVFHDGVCLPTADGANRCGQCATEPDPAAACAAGGTGNSCAISEFNASYGSCRCTSDSQCTGTSNPYCLADPYGSFCGCVVLTSGAPQGIQRCQTNQVCVANVPNDYWASCKYRAGEPCPTDPTRCASGYCTGGVCG
jgi:hypothetical protein